jgi:hypothetical protein
VTTWHDLKDRALEAVVILRSLKTALVLPAGGSSTDVVQLNLTKIQSSMLMVLVERELSPLGLRNEP